MAVYATEQEIKARVEKTGTDMDGVFGPLIEAASREIDRLANRPDGFVALATATDRLYAGSGEAVQWIDECTEITALGVKDSPTDAAYTAWLATDYVYGRGDPVHSPDFNHTPYVWLMVDPTGDYDLFTSGKYTWRSGFRATAPALARAVPTVRVTAKWGYATVAPAEIREATIVLVSQWWKRGASAWADTVAIESGILMYRKVLDPVIKAILEEGRYVRHSL